MNNQRSCIKDEFANTQFVLYPNAFICLFISLFVRIYIYIYICSAICSSNDWYFHKAKDILQAMNLLITILIYIHLTV